MSLDDLVVRVIDALNGQRIPFFLIGGLALSSWVEPRATRDMDIVLRVRRKDSRRVKSALIAAGAKAASLEMRLLMEKRFVRFRVGGPMLDVRICATAHDLKAFERAVEISFETRKLKVATPEDLVLYKLIAWRPIDRADVSAIVEQIGYLDTPYIETWLDPIAEDSGAPMRQRWRSFSE